MPAMENRLRLAFAKLKAVNALVKCFSASTKNVCSNASPCETKLKIKSISHNSGTKFHIFEHVSVFPLFF